MIKKGTFDQEEEISELKDGKGYIKKELFEG